MQGDMGAQNKAPDDSQREAPIFMGLVLSRRKKRQIQVKGLNK